MNKLKYVLLLVVICFILAGCSDGGAEDDIMVVQRYEDEDGKTYNFENKNLEFHFDADTTHFNVVNKRTGQTWYSNPEAEENTAVGNAANIINSTLMLKYTTVNDVQTSIDNFKYSIENKLYTVEELDNGVKVRYTIGDVERTYLIPLAVPESRMKEFYNSMEKTAQRSIDQYYRKISLDKLGATDNRAELTAKYPELKNESIYEIREDLKEHLRAKLEGYFVEAGYTKEDYKEDRERYNINTSTEKPAFNISVVYQLDDNDLVVSVPMEEVEYSKKYPIIELSVLPYMGAGGLEDKGYLLVPDGNGGIINFNNGKTGQAAYYSSVYGWDYGLTRDAVVDENIASFPVFGIANNGGSFICIGEQGSAYATVEADISGKMTNYNNSKFTYEMVHREKMDITAKSDTTVQVFEKGLPQENIVQRYKFIDTVEYTDMAIQYREYLMDKYPSLTKTESADVPVAVELVGAVDTIEHMLGFPVTKPQSLTTYKDALKITKELVESGFTNMSLKYSGWFNRGIKHTSAQKVDTISRLGSKKSLRSLAEYADDQGVDMYLDANFTFVFKNKWLDGFTVNRDSAKHISREIAKLYTYTYIWYGKMEQEQEKYYLLKPSYTLRMITNYAKDIERFGVNNISFADVGRILSGDYNQKSAVSRESVLVQQQGKMSELREQGKKTMISSDNAYAVPYANYVTGMQTNNRKTNIVDESIPFYAIALHGLVPYSGSALNLAQNYEQEYLKAIETGSGLYYLFMNEPATVLQDGRYTKYYAADFSLWKDSATDLYKKFQTALNGTYNQFITGHSKLAEGVKLTEYEDGTKVVVNYNYEDYHYNGKTIPARGYAVEGGGR